MATPAEISQTNSTTAALPKRLFSEATIEVVSVSSSGLPTRFPHIEEEQAHRYLYKAASKVELPGDLIRLGEEVFAYGWPDITVTYRYPGTSASACRELTLASQPCLASPYQTAHFQDPGLHSC